MVSKALVAASGYAMPITVKAMLSENRQAFETVDFRNLNVQFVGSKRGIDILLIAKTKIKRDDEELVSRICEAYPLLPVMIVCLDIDEEQMIRLIRSGVKGLITEDGEFPLITRAVKALIDGELWCPRNLFNIVLQSYQEGDDAQDIGELARHTVLSKREREIVSEMAQGKTNKEIATHLGISYSTVVNHSNNIYRKLDVSNRTAAVHAATELGLLDE